VHRLKLPRISILTTACLFLAACAVPEKKGTPQAAGPRYVGSVMFVDQEHGFVLIDGGSYQPPDVGRKLKSYAGGKETSELVTTPERRDPFISADIVKGTPGQGDVVCE